MQPSEGVDDYRVVDVGQFRLKSERSGRSRSLHLSINLDPIRGGI